MVEPNKDKGNDRKTLIQFLFDWILPIALALFMAFLLNRYLYFKVDVPSGSMIPTIKIGDKIIVSRIYNPNKLKRFDIVVFRSKEDENGEGEEKLLIKRLIGLPGDTITIKNDQFFLNGTKLNEEYLNGTPKNTYFKEFKVPEGKYFFLGDNRDFSYDSRYWDEPFVPAKEIVALAGLRIYPLKSIGFLK